MSGRLSDLLRDVAVDYRIFCKAAEQLLWADAPEWHSVVQAQALGACLDILEFPPGYVAQNLVSAYVQTVLSSIAFSEEWDRDFWSIPQAERRACLTLGARMYQNYAMVREARLIDRTWEHLNRELNFFAQGGINGLEEGGYLDRLAGGRVVEIGGSYSGDYVYFAVKDDTTLLVACGFWD